MILGALSVLTSQTLLITTLSPPSVLAALTAKLPRH
jgi:hypothetical protein